MSEIRTETYEGFDTGHAIVRGYHVVGFNQDLSALFAI